MRDLILQLSKSSIYSTKPLRDYALQHPECSAIMRIID
ncbi:antirestriction protein [Escherichia coli]|nr:antirestriction protein [Escherichia coli]